MEENNLQSTEVQDTTPESAFESQTDIETAEDSSVTPDSESRRQEDVTQDTETSAQNSVSETNVSEPFISVQYNHKNRELSRDEAVTLIQKGMHTESLRNKLEYIASLQGVDVNSLVDRMVKAPENSYRNYLEKIYGKDSPDVEIGMEIYRAKQSEKYKNITAERQNSIEKKNEEIIQSVNSRLADEYLMLKSQMPDAPEYNALPDSVIIEAAEGKRDLYSAYLCYLHKEKLNIDAAKKSQNLASEASSGTMKSDSGDNVSSAEKRFLSGLWEK